MDGLSDLVREYGTWIYILLFAYCMLKSGSLPLFAGYAAVVWHITGFFLTLCGAAAAFVPSAIQGLPDRTLLA